MIVLVVGGSGALGQGVIRQFQAKGTPVRCLDLLPHPDAKVESIVGDIRQREVVAAACQGVDAVIHTASMVSQAPGKPQPLYDVNVTGTENIIAACQQHGVGKLIYTSSIDVVFDGTPIRNGDETLPYPTTHLDYYGTTKMQAEQAVIKANGVGGVATCSLRVAGIYGPGDRHRFPRVIGPTLKSGTYTRMGDGKAVFNHLYVTNAAHAHYLAAERLALDSAVAGQIYFITDHEPGNFFDFFPPYLDALGVRYKVQTIPAALMRLLAALSEWNYTRQGKKDEQIALSRYAVEATCRDFWFNHKKAARDFGYTPVVSAGQAFDETLAWLREWVAQAM